MFEVKKNGEFLRIDESGFIINDANIRNIDSKWMDALESMIISYKNILSNNLISLYIRGSLVYGKAIDYFSDLDSFGIIQKDISSFQKNMFKVSSEELKSKFPFVGKFDFSTYTYNSVFNGNMSYLKAFIKTQSICVYGIDFSDEITKYKPHEIIIELAIIEKKILIANERISLTDDCKIVKYWCAYIMRCFLRATLELIAENEGKYSRDLYLCYQTAVKHYPEKDLELLNILEYAINPTSDKLVIDNIINIYGNWLIGIQNEKK